MIIYVMMLYCLMVYFTSIPEENKWYFPYFKENTDLLYQRVRVSIRPNGSCNLRIFIKRCISIIRLEATLPLCDYISYYQ